MDHARGQLHADFQRNQLHWAVQKGDLAEVERFIAMRYPVNRFDDLGKTPLHYAVQDEHFEIVDRLLEAGANVNANDERTIGNTPLGDHIDKCSFEMAKRLIDAGADPTIPGWMQLTAIYHAEQRKDADAKKIRRLLEDAAKARKT